MEELDVLFVRRDKEPTFSAYFLTSFAIRASRWSICLLYSCAALTSFQCCRRCSVAAIFSRLEIATSATTARDTRRADRRASHKAHRHSTSRRRIGRQINTSTTAQAIRTKPTIQRVSAITAARTYFTETLFRYSTA